MMPELRRSNHATHRVFGMSGPAAGSAGAQVTVSPSRAEVRRAEPSLSFQVTAPGAVGFDVIVATDPTLFDPAHAHRRTPKNFRSSRQDFQGEPIEIETGFYLLPRAFIRDLVSAEPRPTRLYYIAVAYRDRAGTQAVYSVPPEAMAQSAPHVALAGDLVAANLSKVLGMAVDRIGAVSATGRVMAARNAPPILPEAIGGLPVFHRSRPEPAVRPAPAPAGNGAGAPVHTDTLNGNGVHNGRDRPRDNGAPAAQVEPTGNQNLSGNGGLHAAGAPDGNGKPNGNFGHNGNGASVTSPAVAQNESSAAPSSTGAFVDEDYAYGGSTLSATPGFRDLDSGARRSAALSYDDGYGAPSRGFAEDGAAAPAIPPLDPEPDPAPAPAREPAAARPVPQKPNGAAAKPGGAQIPGSTPDEDELLQAVIAEGAGGRYEALSLDGGYRGRFGQGDPYHRRAHDGLRLGPHQAMQDSGELGELLTLMRAADGAGFAQTFGPDAEAMLAMVTSEGPSGLDAGGGRGPRVQPVAGSDLWEDPWVDRFRAAARHPPFQAAMRAQILARRLDPLKPAAEALGIDSPRGIAMVLALAIQRGAEGALAHLRAAVNPFDTPARLGAALDALGYSDLGAFRASSGLPPGDTVDASTHLALFAALRDLGPDSPVQVPDGEGVMDALVTAAGPGTLGDALLKLRVSPAFGDVATE